MFVDTHCHLTMMDDENVVQEAAAAGVTKIVTVATTLKDSRASIELAQKQENVFATVGIHPCDATSEWQDDFKQIKKLVETAKVVGLGETGLDFYHKPFDKQRQIDLFQAHIECALRHDLPVVVHIRNSADAVLKTLEPYTGKLRGVAHCFSQDKAVADQLLAWGFYLGIGGPITYPKNDALRELFAGVPLEKILLETDAPFLPPQQHRGAKNHPKYIPLIAQALANVHKIDLHTVSAKTTANAEKLFKI